VRGFPLAESPYDFIDRAIQLIRRVPRLDSLPLPDVFGQVRFLHPARNTSTSPTLLNVKLLIPLILSAEPPWIK
jgi:hypothetical protein